MCMGGSMGRGCRFIGARVCFVSVELLAQKLEYGCWVVRVMPLLRFPWESLLSSIFDPTSTTYQHGNIPSPY